MTAADLVGLAWTWSGPTRSQADDEEPYFELRIAELPDFFVAARSQGEARAMAAQALEAFLESYLSQGMSPRLPSRVVVPVNQGTAVPFSALVPTLIVESV